MNFPSSKSKPRFRMHECGNSSMQSSLERKHSRERTKGAAIDSLTIRIDFELSDIKEYTRQYYYY